MAFLLMGGYWCLLDEHGYPYIPWYLVAESVGLVAQLALSIISDSRTTLCLPRQPHPKSIYAQPGQWRVWFSFYLTSTGRLVIKRYSHFGRRDCCIEQDSARKQSWNN